MIVAGQIDGLLERVRLYASIVDQLLRGLDSILLNIAEGAAYTSQARRRNHFRIARASAAECIAILDRIQQRRPGADVRPIRRNLQMISKMLTRLINAHTPD